MTLIGKPRVLAIVGPTASGKTSLAIAVAKALRDSPWRGAEIVGTDSMQCYRGMVVGTAAPTAQELDGIPHHMLEVWPATFEVSVAEFQREARRAIEDVTARGLLPIVVGGSGLYVSAVLDDLRFPGTDPVVRARWEGELERVGSHRLHAVLAERDSEAAAAILPSNGRRIVRALEVIELTGGTFTASLPEPTDVYATTRVGLEIARDELDVRIATRVERMWADGLLDEVTALQEQGMSRTAERALGYRQAIDQLRGSLDEAEAQQSTVAATVKFARRQQRWFRRDARVSWIDYAAPDLVDQVLETLEGGTDT